MTTLQLTAKQDALIDESPRANSPFDAVIKRYQKAVLKQTSRAARKNRPLSRNESAAIVFYSNAVKTLEAINV